MMKDLSEKKLKELQTALQDVEKVPLPVETRAALNSLRQELDTLLTSSVVEREQNRLAALYRVSHSLGTSLDIDVVLTQVMDAVIDLIGAERGFIFLARKEDSKWELRAARSVIGSEQPPNHAEVSQTVIQNVFSSGEGIVATDAMTDPRFSEQASVILNALRSVLCAPLRVRGEIIGVVYVDNRALSGRFGEDDLALLNAFANQAAIAIENARLYTRTDRALSQRLSELETLSRIDEELNSNLDIQHVLEMVQLWAVRGTGAGSCQVYLVDDDRQLWTDAPISLPFLSAESSPVLQRAVQKRSSSVFRTDAGDEYQILVPIWLGEKALGVIHATRTIIFNQRDEQFLSRLANRAAAAIENSRLFLAVQHTNQEKSQFVSIVSHELRIPMTAIRGYAELMLGGAAGPLSEQQTKFLDTIHNNVLRMAELVSDLSDISRIETGRLKLNISRVSLLDTIDEVVQNMKPRYEEKALQMQVELNSPLPEVMADPVRLLQILENLINNACKYTPENGKIWVRAHSNARQVKVEICDNGIGISPKDQAQLFAQFFRSDHPVVVDQPGWGLGLHVTSRLVELMGGEVGVESALDRGSTFWFTLPAAE